MELTHLSMALQHLINNGNNNINIDNNVYNVIQKNNKVDSVIKVIDNKNFDDKLNLLLLLSNKLNQNQQAKIENNLIISKKVAEIISNKILNTKEESRNLYDIILKNLASKNIKGVIFKDKSNNDVFLFSDNIKEYFNNDNNYIADLTKTLILCNCYNNCHQDCHQQCHGDCKYWI